MMLYLTLAVNRQPGFRQGAVEQRVFPALFACLVLVVAFVLLSLKFYSYGLGALPF